jgi:uncharacterized membrane protein
MSDLLVVEFPTEAQAERARTNLLNMQREYLIDLGDAVIATKCDAGKVRLNQLYSPVKSGAVSGMFWGSLIGFLFLMPLVGAALGAGAGALGGKFTDVGIDDPFMKEVGQSLQSGNAALFLLIRKMTTDRVVDALRAEGGKVMRSSFDETKEAEVREALDRLQHTEAAATLPS